jgi:hypothetical protein
MAGTGGSHAGVFVVFQSAQDPSAALGRASDLWVGLEAIHVKTSDEVWTLWDRTDQICYPRDNYLLLTWSAHIQFKYVAQNTTKTEIRRWDAGLAILFGYSHALTFYMSIDFTGSSINTHLRSPNIEAILQKKYRLLTTSNIVTLYNTKLQSVRENSPPVPPQVPDHQPREEPPCNNEGTTRSQSTHGKFLSAFPRTPDHFSKHKGPQNEEYNAGLSSFEEEPGLSPYS